MDIANNLKIELETDSAGLPNLINNNNGDLGAWEWLTPVANTTLTQAAAAQQICLQFTTTASQAAYFTTEAHPAIVGKYYSARIDAYDATASHTYRMSFEWLDSSGAYLSSSTQGTANSPGTSSAAATAFYGAYQAPSGAAYVRLRIDLYNGTGTTNPAANAYLNFNHAMLTYADSGTAITSRTNLMTNPSAETNTNCFQSRNGTPAALSVATDQYMFGTHSLKNIQNASWPIDLQINPNNGGTAPLAKNTYYTVSFYIRCSVARQFRAYCEPVDTSTYNTTTIYGSTVTLAANTWTRYSMTFNSGNYNGLQQFGIQGTDGLGGAATYWVDGILIEAASSAGTYFDGSIVPSGFATSSWAGTANASTSTTQTAANQFDYTEGLTYVDITGSSTNVDTNRSELDVGIATVTIYDALLDPATVTSIHPGRKVRISIPDSDGNAAWPLITGTLSDAKSAYDPKTGKPTISLSVSDAVKDLANQAENRIVGSIDEIPAIMEGKGVPWNVNGNTSQVATSTVVATNGNASTIDSIAVTRDSTNGYAWVDRNGVLNAWSTAPEDADFGKVLLSDNPVDLAAVNGYYTNLVTNPRFGAGTTSGWALANASWGWDTTNSKLMTDGGYVGSNYYRMVAGTAPTTNGPYVGNLPLTPNTNYYAVFWVRSNAAAAVQFKVNIERKVGTTGTPNSAPGPLVTVGAGQATTWTPIAVQFNSSTYDTGTVTLYRNGSGPAFATGEYLDIGAAMLVASPTPVPYFDGDTPGYQWTGTANASTSVPAYSSAFSYSDIDASFSWDEIINTVNVTYLRSIGGTTQEITYPARTNAASVAAYGPVSKDFTIVLPSETPTAIQAFQDAVLAANANPRVKVNSLTVPVKDLYTAISLSYVDLYSTIYLTYSDKFSAVPHRVASIEHSIDPTGWTIKYTFQSTGSVASPAMTPAPGVVSASSLAGIVQMFAGNNPPDGWVLCDGRALSRTQYSALFNAIGTAYGAGDGSNTFNIPNLKGRTVLGVGQSNAAGATNHTLGQVGGEETHLLTAAESGVPAHDHATTLSGTNNFVRYMGANNGAMTTTFSGGTLYLTGQALTVDVSPNSAANASARHNVLSPYVAMNYIINIG